MDSLVGLVRRFAVEFMNGHNPDVCRDIMDPDYVLRVGGAVISGRDAEYLPAVQQQLDQFPGMVMTVHEVVYASDQIAIHFSEHGASGGAGGPVAAWQGIALYRGNGSQLTACVAEEDYYARRRQLKSGAVDTVAAPAAAPWDTTPQPPDPAAEAVVRRWLGDDLPAVGQVRFDDGLTPIQFESDDIEVNEFMSAGDGVAFQVRQTGRYLSGLGDTPASTGAIAFNSVGIVRVADGHIVGGQVIRDRAGLAHRAKGSSTRT